MNAPHVNNALPPVHHTGRMINLPYVPPSAKVAAKEKAAGLWGLPCTRAPCKVITSPRGNFYRRE